MTNLQWALIIIAIAIVLSYAATIGNPCAAMNESSCDSDIARQF